MVHIEKELRRHLLGTHALGSLWWNWLAMLRSVKNVPGFALKTVPSLTRLSEHPMNMKGGAKTSVFSVGADRIICIGKYLGHRP